MAASDGDIGHISDLVVSDEDWAVRYLVVDTRDWLPGKHVLLPPAVGHGGLGERDASRWI